MNTFVHPARDEAHMIFLIAIPILIVTVLSLSLRNKFRLPPKDKTAWYVDPKNIAYGLGLVYGSGAFFGLAVSDNDERNLNRVLANGFLANALNLNPYEMSTLEVCGWSALVTSSCFAIFVLICFAVQWIGHHVGRYCGEHGIHPSWNEPVIIKRDETHND